MRRHPETRALLPDGFRFWASQARDRARCSRRNEYALQSERQRRDDRPIIGASSRR